MAETLYYHYNHLGSTTAVTDKSGNIVYKFAYGTYGELTAVTGKAGNSLIQPEEGKTIQECLNGAATCALSALPVFGSMAGGAAKLVMKNARTANKVANCIQSVSKVMSFTATATMSAIDTGYAVSDAYTAAKNGNLTVGAVGSVVLNATATVLAGAATVGSVTKAADAISGLRSEPINHAMSGVSASTSKLHNDVRSGNEVGLGNGNTVGASAKDATVGNKAKDVVKGQGKSPSEVAKSWQGIGDYSGVDDYIDVTVKKGTILYRGEPNGTEYFTTMHAIEQSGRNATKIFEGLQVKKSPVHGYREKMQGYLFDRDVVGAYGIAKANPQFGQGGLPQYFIPNVSDLIDRGSLIPTNIIKLYK